MYVIAEDDLDTEGEISTNALQELSNIILSQQTPSHLVHFSARFSCAPSGTAIIFSWAVTFATYMCSFIPGFRHAASHSIIMVRMEQTGGKKIEVKNSMIG